MSQLHPNIYSSQTLDQASAITVDRGKQINPPSTLFQWNNSCSALDAEWQCLPYAYRACDKNVGSDSYLECLHDRFHACRQAAGCNYTHTVTPAMCTHPEYTDSTMFNNAVKRICNHPSKEYPSERSYLACVDKMKDWVAAGCANLQHDQPMLNSSN